MRRFFVAATLVVVFIATGPTTEEIYGAGTDD